jgi:twinkle protein
MNELEFANKYLGEYKAKGAELNFKYCFACGGGQHHDQYTFSINTEKHTFHCMRGKCNEGGTFKDLAEKYNEEADYYLEWLKENNIAYDKTPEYIQPKYRVKELTTQVINYFYNRGITLQTLLYGNVKALEGGFAVFQFWEEDKLVMNKIRLARQPVMVNNKMELKEWKEKGGKHVLWNMQNINLKLPVILTEGMVDALSVMEANEMNVVSIPSGTNDMTWIKNCYDWINKVTEWVLYVDNDEAGEKLKNELLIKFKIFKCRIVKHELKDANEELQTFGTEYINTVIENAKFQQVEGITNMAEVQIVDPSKMERCLTGISLIDKFAGGYIFPSLNIWTGERGSGKSTVLSQTLLNCVDKGYKVFIYSGELMAGYFKLWLCSQAVGAANVTKEIDKDTASISYKPKLELMPRINKWLNNKMYFYNDSNSNEEDKVLAVMLDAYKRYNCRVFVLDNLMTIKFNSSKDGIFRSQSNFVDRLRLFVKTYNLIVNLVVHPNKQGEVIGGSGDIRNSAFNEFWVKKLDDNTKFNTTIKITKNRYYGITGIERGYFFSPESKRIYEQKENETIYGWENLEAREVQGTIPF